VPTLFLYSICILIWGSTWIAITYQLGVVEPVVSVALRFITAALLLFGICFIRAEKIRYGRRDHAFLALQGLLMYSAGYVCVYEAEARVVSGLVAVGYSASPIANMLCARLLYGTPLSRRVAAGGLFGIAGIVLVFAPEFARLSATPTAAAGVVLTAIAVSVQAFASAVASRNGERGIAVWPALAWGMTYGAIGCSAWVLLTGTPIAFDLRPGYVLSWAWLTIFGSIIAFGAYLTLLIRIGAGRAGYIGVMVPVIALIISALFEGYRWAPATWAGIVLAVAGNFVALGGLRSVHREVPPRRG
jgi:drug/metabolite transporter (DMT)-like permease